MDVVLLVPVGCGLAIGELFCTESRGQLLGGAPLAAREDGVGLRVVVAVSRAGLAGCLRVVEGLRILGRTVFSAGATRWRVRWGVMRVRGLSRVRVGQLLAVVVVGAGGVLVFGVGSAFASGSYTCTGVAATDTPGLQAVINTGGTVTVFGPLPCKGNWTVPVSVTIQGGSPGVTLNGNATGTVLTVTAAVTLTVRNLTVTNGAAADGAGIFDHFCASIVNVSNAVVAGNAATNDGGGVDAECAAVNVSGSSVSGNFAGSQGGGVALDGGSTLTLTASRLNANTAADSGGGSYAEGASTVKAINSTVAGNSAGSDHVNNDDGGGIWSGGSTVILTGATVSGNAADDGGGLNIDFGSTLVATGSTISDNTADGRGGDGFGGGIRVFDSSVSLTTTKVAGNANTSSNSGLFEGDGGGIYFEGASTASVSLADSSVDHNTTVHGDGAGIANVSSGFDAPLTIDSSSVSFNFAKVGDGGGLANYGVNGNTASAVVTGSTLIGNLARSGNGGAIANVTGISGGTATLTLASTNVASGPPYLNPNQAKLGGGVYNDASHGPASVSLQAGANIVHNQATIDGGGVYNTGGGTLLIAPGAIILFNTPDNIS